MNFIVNKIVQHFWGIVEGILVSAVVGLAINAMEKAGCMKPTLDHFKLAYETFDTVGDTLGTYGLIAGIPSAITYLFGYIKGKYPKYPQHRR